MQVEILDVANLASVRAFADRWDATGRPLHALINNAGIFTLAGCVRLPQFPGHMSPLISSPLAVNRACVKQ